VVVWRNDGNQLQKRFELEGVGYVHALAFSPDANTLAIGTQDQTTRLFDIRTDVPKELNVLRHKAPVKGLSFDPKGELLAVATDAVQLWDITQNPPLAGREAPLGLGSPLDSVGLAFSRDGSQLFYVDGTAVRRWETAHPFRAPGELDASVSSVVSLSVRAHDNHLLTVVQRDGGTEILTRDFTSLATPPKQFVEWTDSGLNDLSFSPDGQRFVVAAYRKHRYALQLWDQSQAGPKRLATADLELGHPGSFWCTAFSPAREQLASGHRDGAIRLWDISKGQLQLQSTLPEVHWGGIGALDYSPDGRVLASVDWGGGVKLWDATEDRLSLMKSLGRHTHRSHGVRFSPDGHMLASCDFGGEIKLWRIDSDSPRPTDLKSHTANVTSLSFTPDGRRLLSSGADGRVIVWDVSEAKPLREWQFPGYVYDARFDPTGQRIVSANGNGSIYVWEADSRLQVGPRLR
jgi:WD40 repeat protein